MSDGRGRVAYWRARRRSVVTEAKRGGGPPLQQRRTQRDSGEAPGSKRRGSGARNRPEKGRITSPVLEWRSQLLVAVVG